MSRIRTARALSLAMFLLLASQSVVPAQEMGALSPRIANYTIEVRLDPSQKTLESKEVLTWRNDMEVPANELWFHLYWNAWKNNKSTWLREDTLRPALSGRNRKEVREGDWSYCNIKSVKLLASGSFQEADLTSQMRYASPDDNNPDDQTVMVVRLPRSVEPRETVRVEIAWKSKIPRTFARTGFRGNYFFIVQWFPKVGVYQANGTWNCHQFHAATEFYSDFGVYDVDMTVPKGWLLGATGLQLEVRNNPDGTTTHHYQQSDVHDFAWTTSPEYLEARRRFQEPGLRLVDMRLLYEPEHQSQVERHFRATKAALKYYGVWFGEYPYGHITIVDPAYGSGAGGMEYPTLFTCGTRYWNPEGGGSPEGVTVHEAGHQFWYGIVANNEFEDAWLDEGFNTFSTDRVIEVAFGYPSFVRRFFRGFFPVRVPGLVLQRMTGGARLDGYRAAVRADIQSAPTFQYHPNRASLVTYNKTSLWLATLENTLSWTTLQKILSTYFQRWKFRHPKPEDFFSIASEVSGRNLSPFFNEVHRKAAVFDYSVESVASEEVKSDGYIDKEGEPVYTKSPERQIRLYETRVVVRRLQDGILPVDVLLKFESGEEVWEVWDASYLWKLYRVVKPSKLEYAVIDPERKIVLDINYTNNSKMLSSKAGFPASKWASKWMIWLQDYLQTLSFII